MKREYKTICKNCGKEFIANTYGKYYCDDCDKEINWNKCIICGKPVRKKVCCSPECLSIHRSKNNPSKRPEVREKLKETGIRGIEAAKKTNLEKYGVEFPFQNKEVQEKCRETQIKNNNGNLAWNTDKQKETMIEKYGAQYSMQVPEIVNKQKETWQNTLKTKYGVNSPIQIPKVKKQIENTNLKRYGVKYILLTDKAKEAAIKSTKERFQNMTDEEKKIFFKNLQLKSKETLLKTRGVINVGQLPEVKEKIKETFIKKYGVDHPMKDSKIRKKAMNSSKKSSLEKRTEEFLKTKNINYQTQYLIQNGNLMHSYDFAIFNENNELSILVECDGIYFHGYTSDANDKHVHDEEYYYNIIKLVPENVKFIKIIESNFEEGISELSNALGLNYNNYVNEIFDWCKSIEFPYPNYTDKILNNSYKQLLEYKPENNTNIKIGNKIIKHFHKSIYKCYVNNKPSAYEAWNNDELLLKCIKNRIIYKDYVDPSRILAGFTINKIAPVPKMFSPFIAKYLINKYLNEYDVIFDPFSGYSGRMLGAIANNKNYIGQDINEITINESKQIIDYFNLNNKIKLKVQNIINDDYKDYDCLFTCPPYNLKENWNNENQLNLSCDKWIDICLSTYNCKKYLFVVDNTEKYKDYIVEELVNKSHFGTNTEKVILIEK